MTPRLKEIYNKEIQPALKDSLNLKNVFMTPKVEKIVLQGSLQVSVIICENFRQYGDSSHDGSVWIKNSRRT